MGSEVSTYMAHIVDLMQQAYGSQWHITTRAESPVTDTVAWQVMVGVSREPVIERDGALGIHLTLECAATVRYVSKATDHASGFQAVDIANTLAAWLANTVDPVTGVFPDNLEVGIEPITMRVPPGMDVNTGRYVAHVFWTVKFDRINPDIDIPGYNVGHPDFKTVGDTDLGVDITDIDVRLGRLSTE